MYRITDILADSVQYYQTMPTIITFEKKNI